MTSRILFVINHAGFFLSHRLPIALAAKAAGYDVHVATPRSKHVPPIIEHGLPWHPIALSRSGLNPLYELYTMADLYRLYRRLKPDLVHHVTSKPVLYGTLAARFARVPAVVNAISGMGHVFSERNEGNWLPRFVSRIYRVALRHPRMRVIFQNDEHKSAFLREKWVREEETVLIPGSGVDTSTFVPAIRGSDPPIVLLASRMLYTKGVAEFVEAARLLKAEGTRARFMLVGEPDPDNLATVPEPVLRRWQSEGTIEYTGRQENMPAIFAAADIACLPSYYGEGIPKVLIEAAACGLPIVTTDWPGCRDVVKHGETGLLVPIKDAASLAAAIRELLDDPARRRRMGELGRERVLMNFSLERVVEQTLDLYRTLIE